MQVRRHTRFVASRPRWESTVNKRIPVIAGALVGLLLAAYVGLSVVVYNQLSIVQAKCGDHLSEANFTPAAFMQVASDEYKPLDTTPYLMPDYTQVSFPSRDKQITVSGFYVKARGVDPATAPAVIIVHGVNDCKRRAVILTAGGMLSKHGFNVLLIDLRNHGDSTVNSGRMAGGSTEFHDVLGAWDWLVTDKKIPPQKVGLMGFSLGAAISMIAAGEEPRVAAVWEDSGFGSLDKILRSELGRIGMPEMVAPGAVLAGRAISGDNLLAYEPLQEVKKLGGRPIFIVHGDADKRVAVSTAAELAAAINATGGHVTPWITHGTQHIQSIFDYPDTYEEKLAAFFTASLANSH
jgi:dipeptidyl aminopeptidase/acylaminoacyl peptidase